MSIVKELKMLSLVLLSVGHCNIAIGLVDHTLDKFNSVTIFI